MLCLTGSLLEAVYRKNVHSLNNRFGIINGIAIKIAYVVFILSVAKVKLNYVVARFIVPYWQSDELHFNNFYVALFSFYIFFPYFLLTFIPYLSSIGSKIIVIFFYFATFLIQDVSYLTTRFQYKIYRAYYKG